MYSKNIKSTFVTFVFVCFVFTNVKSQITNKNSNFYEIEKAFNDTWLGKEPNMLDESKNVEMGGWQQYKRWANFMKIRCQADGTLPKPGCLFEEWQKYKQTFTNNKSNSFSGKWSYLGPDNIPSAILYNGGTGRVNCMAFDPNNSNSMWIGTPNGGLWHSTDGGNTWASNTDLLPNLGVSDIAIDPQNTQNMYIATGDKFGLEINNGIFWGGTYSAGVLKSTNGGKTWDTTALTYNMNDYTSIQRIILIPDSPSVILVAASNGLWRSSDYGQSFTQLKNDAFYDMELNPGNASIIYAASQTSIYKSTDYGKTWNVILNSYGLGRVSLAVTAANNSVLYAWFEYGYLYKSSDDGLTFTKVNDLNNIMFYYGSYDMAFVVSQTDENTLIVGGMDLYKSTDGGNIFNQISYWDNPQTSSAYVHADQHCLTYLPGSGSTLFSGNDGGIFKSTDGGSTWVDITQDMGITQLYRIGSSYTDPYLIYMGAQDNGSIQYNNGTSTTVCGADGMECLVDYTDKNISYVSSQMGELFKSIDGGLNYTYVNTPSGDWTTPFVMDPIDHNTLYFGGYYAVYKTTNGGNTWNAITSTTSNFAVNALIVAEADNQYIYYSLYNNIFVTKDGGNNWASIKSGLPVSYYLYISSISVSSIDPEKVWITLAGYGSGEKIYFSDNAGASWTNISGSLPNIPFNCSVYQKNSNNAVYIGSDFGVFYKDDSMQDWMYFNTGLPNVIISELEINETASKIRAATYGRGLWESDLMPSSSDSIINVNFTASSTTITIGETIDFTDLSSGYPDSWQWTFNGAVTTSSNMQNPSSVQYNAAGTYEVNLTASNAKSSDSKTISDYITVIDSSSSSIIDVEFISFNIYPNPTNGIIEINFNYKSTSEISIQLSNCMGEILYDTNIDIFSKKSLALNLTNYPKGIYFVKCSTDKNLKIEKIILE